MLLTEGSTPFVFGSRAYHWVHVRGTTCTISNPPPSSPRWLVKKSSPPPTPYTPFVAHVPRSIVLKAKDDSMRLIRLHLTYCRRGFADDTSIPKSIIKRRTGA
ncbi:hypothetical protein CDAR_240601 [Caerostris darwini]|uniref:Uncharacterized protein n=1 Tax=Caerostris darwini TaxID=1538125 RepID=A0AAV4PTD7_9ARAC|nr:hypothetical protein CDAR_240601 [Caerostris darwini]